MILDVTLGGGHTISFLFQNFKMFAMSMPACQGLGTHSLKHVETPHRAPPRPLLLQVLPRQPQVLPQQRQQLQLQLQLQQLPHPTVATKGVETVIKRKGNLVVAVRLVRILFVRGMTSVVTTNGTIFVWMMHVTFAVVNPKWSG
mmetsp:Transcript_22313/g.48491  ORF Transcript_22313/g.48491 Transcript_22313/m.48491 type:complete len:144 (-) Transcript_22313:80-511(-)